jgi:hypothetical protein
MAWRRFVRWRRSYRRGQRRVLRSGRVVAVPNTTVGFLINGIPHTDFKPKVFLQ